MAHSLRRSHVLMLLAVLVVTRAAALVVGVRFDASGLPTYIHFLDPHLLRHDLVGSLWYLHAQPPLFDAYLGLVLHLPDALHVPVFALTYWGLGAVLALSLALLMVELGVGATAATAAAAAFVASPAAILYESWLFNTYAVATLATAAALALCRWARLRSPRWGIAAFSAFAALALLRSTFHLVWLVVLVALVVMARRRAWRQVLAVALVPVAVVALVYVKNAVVVGQPAVTMWQGMNLSLETTFAIPEPERRAMVDRGELSPLALLYPFQPLDAYAPYLTPPPPTGVPALDEPRKANGAINWNAKAYVAIDHQYLSDALTAARTHPDLVAHRVVHAAALMFATASDYDTLRANAAHIHGWDSFWAHVVELELGSRTADRPGLPTSGLSLTWLAVYLLAAIGAVFGAGRSWRKRGAARGADVARLAIGWTIAFAAVTSLLVGSGENNRFRFELDPLALALAAATVAEIVRERRWRRTVGMPAGRPPAS